MSKDHMLYLLFAHTELDKLPNDIIYERFDKYTGKGEFDRGIGHAMQITYSPYGIIRVTGNSFIECVEKLTKQFKLVKEKIDETKSI